MRSIFFALALSLSCGDSEDECDSILPPGAPRGHQDLPSTDDEGNPWPTYSEATADLEDCTRDEGYRRFRGTCSDGKRFLSRDGGYTGNTRYYGGEGEALVGFDSFSDVILECVDPSVGDSRCERTSIEEILCP